MQCLVFYDTKEFTVYTTETRVIFISHNNFKFGCLCGYVSISCVYYESSGWSSQTKFSYLAVESSFYDVVYERVSE